MSLSCSIVGGGISGLIAGKLLQQYGFKVTILDKGRGLGGRMATRRIRNLNCGEGIFDYGAQYITAISQEFKHYLNSWEAIGLVGVWNCASRSSEELDIQRYYGIKSMRSIAQHIATDLNTHNSKKITRLNWNGTSWTISADDGSSYISDILVLTPPLPQTLQLLEESDILLPSNSLHELGKVSYRMCLAVLAIASGPIQIGHSGGCSVKDDKLIWISSNRQKGISPDCYALTLHANPEFSERHYDKSKREQAAQELIDTARKYLGRENILAYQVHVWKYSTPMNYFNDIFFSPQRLSDSVEHLGPLYIAGDSFTSRYEGTSSFENAFLSGLEVANYIYNLH